MKDFDRIDRLRREWSDKYVEVDADVPTLRRFAGRLGRVMTINMNGRALVQFTATNDIGWYDIDLARLRIVAAPALERQKTEGPAKPKAPPRDVHEAAESNVRLAAAEEAAAELAEEVAEANAGDAKPKKPLSTADILAAARASKSAAPSTGEAKAGPAPKKLSTEEILAAARAKKAAKETASPASDAAPKPATDQASPKKAMTTEEILAAARARKAPKESASTSDASSQESAKTDRPPARKAMTTEEILAAARAKKAPTEPKSEPDAQVPDASSAKTDRPAKKALTTEEILAMARQKKRPGEASEPGKNPPERRHASPDMGEEET